MPIFEHIFVPKAPLAHHSVASTQASHQLKHLTA
nr:MAG TPA: hypothetical protein [Caudoviricetes sp.]